MKASATTEEGRRFRRKKTAEDFGMRAGGGSVVAFARSFGASEAEEGLPAPTRSAGGRLPTLR